METRLSIKNRDPVLTAVVGDNSDLIKQVSDLYINDGAEVLDATYGNGVFWKKVDTDRFTLRANDIDEDRGDMSYDFRALPAPWENHFDAVVLDPPYAHTGGKHSKMKYSIDVGYKNDARQEDFGISRTHDIHTFYMQGIAEAKRVLSNSGLLLVKCMDQIEGGKQNRHHIWIWKDTVDMGFIDEDLFVLVQTGTPAMRHKYQLHARKNNSFLWVFRNNE